MSNIPLHHIKNLILILPFFNHHTPLFPPHIYRKKYFHSNIFFHPYQYFFIFECELGIKNVFHPRLAAGNNNTSKNVDFNYAKVFV